MPQADEMQRIQELQSKCEGLTSELKIDSNSEILKIKELRVYIDEAIQKVKSMYGSRERSLVITKLQEAVMWLGMDLKRLGTANPYPNSRELSNTIVDKTADGLKL
jgi:hypothetical protein